jgi:cytochrome c oxidase subunit 2
VVQNASTEWGQHSVLEPLGAHAQHIQSIWHVMLWVCGFMYLLVFIFTALTIIRQRRIGRQSAAGHGEEADEQHARDAANVSGERKMMLLLMVWGVMVVAGLFFLTLMSFFTDRSLLHAADDPQLKIKVTAHQWWWEVQYENANPSQQIRTANEIYLPVNTRVEIALVADDVIHSFWVPNLHGKVDLIPGRNNQIRLQPLHIGRYRGECAEFCGLQHANMAFDVVVQSDADFNTWQTAQRESAASPDDAFLQHGQAVFLNGACASCHTISGTEAAGTMGPDLSHVASRLTLAAGTLPNSVEHMREWLQDPPKVKPGTRMPKVELSSNDIDALSAYLASLQ